MFFLWTPRSHLGVGLCAQFVYSAEYGTEDDGTTFSIMSKISMELGNYLSTTITLDKI